MDNLQRDVLAAQVMANPKYKSIAEAVVLRLSQEALSQGLTGKAAIKSVRNKLHQVGGAYIKTRLDFNSAIQDLAKLSMDQNTDAIKSYCRKMMKVHASTAERLPILDDFFHSCLAPIAPVTSVIDLACGLNPLAIPWMPLSDDAQYLACDIYLDMLGLINAFFGHINLKAEAKPCDLVSTIPSEKAQVAFLLKSIPCLEQMDKSIALRLLESLQTEHILVSFPIHSLGGRQKGMESFYLKHFNDLLTEKKWQVREYRFQTELAFLVSK